MTLERVLEILDAKVQACPELLNEDVASACGADLMSDVLAFSQSRSLLLTGLVNPQTIRTAEMMDMRAVMFVRGKIPTPEMIELAKEMGMVLLTTQCMMYEACGRLYSQGLK